MARFYGGTSGGGVSEEFVNEQIQNVVGIAPETLDTLSELADAIGDNPNFATDLQQQINTKADSSALTGLATEEYVDTAIDSIPAPDLTGLATEEYVDSAIAAGGPGGISNPSDFSEVSVILPLNDVTAKKSDPYVIAFPEYGSEYYKTADGINFETIPVIGNGGSYVGSEYANYIFRKSSGEITVYPNYLWEQVRKSTDNGQTWTRSSATGNYDYYLFRESDGYSYANNGNRVISFRLPDLYYSDNGIEFISAPSSSPAPNDGYTWHGRHSVVWDGSKFVYVGIEDNAEATNPKKILVSTSTDGLSWTAKTELAISQFFNFNTVGSFWYNRIRLSYVSGRYFLSVSDHTLLYSDDLVAWNSVYDRVTQEKFATYISTVSSDNAIIVMASQTTTSPIEFVTKIYSPKAGYDELTTVLTPTTYTSNGFYDPSYAVVTDSFTGFYGYDWNVGNWLSYKLNVDGSWTETQLNKNFAGDILQYDVVDTRNVRFDGVIEDGLVKDTTKFEVPGLGYFYTKTNDPGMGGWDVGSVSYDLETLQDIPTRNLMGVANNILFSSVSKYDSNLGKYFSKFYTSQDGLNFQETVVVPGGVPTYEYYISDVVYHNGSYVFVATGKYETPKFYNLYHSADLVSWTTVDLLQFTDNVVGQVPFLATNGSKLLVTSNGSEPSNIVLVFDSLTGTPTAVSNNDYSISNISYDSTVESFMLFFQNNEPKRSTDGLTWIEDPRFPDGGQFNYPTQYGSSTFYYSSISNIINLGSKYVLESMGGMTKIICNSDLSDPKEFTYYLNQKISEYSNLNTWSMYNATLTNFDNKILFTVGTYDMMQTKRGFVETNLDDVFSFTPYAGSKAVSAYPLQKTNQILSSYVENYVDSKSSSVAVEVVSSTLSASPKITSPAIVGGSISGTTVGADVQVKYPLDVLVSRQYLSMPGQTSMQYWFVGNPLSDNSKSYILSQSYDQAGMGQIKTLNGSIVEFVSGNLYYDGVKYTLPAPSSSSYGRSYRNLYYANNKYFLSGIEYSTFGQDQQTLLYYSDNLSDWTNITSVLSGDTAGPNKELTVVDIHYDAVAGGYYQIVYEFGEYDQINGWSHEVKIGSLDSAMNVQSPQTIGVPAGFDSMRLVGTAVSPNKKHRVFEFRMQESNGRSDILGILRKVSGAWAIVTLPSTFQAGFDMMNQADTTKTVAITNSGNIFYLGYDNVDNQRVARYSTDGGNNWSGVTTSIPGVLDTNNNIRLSVGKRLIVSISSAIGQYYWSNDGINWNYYGPGSSYGSATAANVVIPISDAFLNLDWGI